MSDPIVVDVTTPAPIEVTLTEAVVILGGGGGGGAVISVEGRTGAVTLGDLFAAIVHAHVVSDVTGLQAALDAKQPAGSYAPLSHSHTIADVTGLQAALDGKQVAGSYAATVHSHVIGDTTGLQAALDAKAPLASPTFTGTVSGVTKAMVGLGSVDNTTDAAKPVSSAQQTALDLKAPLASPAFTGTPTGITKTHVGLANVDNTSDANKPVSTAQQTALDLKANSSHAHAAADVTSGTMATARLGSGTADGTTFLRGDQTWATPSGGGGAGGWVYIPKVGEFLGAFSDGTGTSGSAQASGDVPGCPIYVSEGMTIDALMFRVVTNEVGVNTRVLLYSSDADGRPSTLIADETGVSSTGNIVCTLGAAEVLTPGLYWGFLRSDGGSTIRYQYALMKWLPFIQTATAGLGSNGPSLSADPGTYASPAATIAAWTLGNSNNNEPAWVALRRSA